MKHYKIKEQAGYTNSAVIADGSEVVSTGPNEQNHWNSIHVVNNDTATDVKILLDNGLNQTAAAEAGKLFHVRQDGGILILGPEDGIKFRQVVQTNDSSTTAEDAGKLIINLANKEMVR